MLSCVIKTSQTSECRMKGGDFAVGGADLRESTRTMPPSVWMAQAAMVRYTFAYPVATPSTTRYAPGLQEWVGLRLASAYFFFFFFFFILKGRT